MQWNNPNRSDYYQMQISREIRGLFVSGVDINDFRIPFSSKSSSQLTQAEIDKKAKEDSEKDGPPGPLTKEQVSRYRMEFAKVDRLVALGFPREEIPKLISSGKSVS